MSGILQTIVGSAVGAGFPLGIAIGWVLQRTRNNAERIERLEHTRVHREVCEERHAEQ